VAVVVCHQDLTWERNPDVIGERSRQANKIPSFFRIKKGRNFLGHTPLETETSKKLSYWLTDL